MNVTEHFKQLGAPLSNSRGSWGAVREDGTVVLRVWQDRIKNKRVLVWDKIRYQGDDRFGAKERMRHIEQIRNGADVWLMVCRAVDPGANPRTIEDSTHRAVMIGGELIEDDAGIYVTVVGRRDD